MGLFDCLDTCACASNLGHMYSPRQYGVSPSIAWQGSRSVQSGLDAGVPGFQVGTFPPQIAEADWPSPPAQGASIKVQQDQVQATWPIS